MKKVALLLILFFVPFCIVAQSVAGTSEMPDGFDSDFTPAATPVEQKDEAPVEQKLETSLNNKNLLFPSFKALEMSAAYNTGTAFETYRVYGNLKFLLRDESVSMDVGLQYGPGTIDAMTSAVYWPLRFTHVKVGVGLIYNLEFFSDISMTNNLLPGIYVDYRPCSWFTFDAMTSFFIKARTIYVIADVKPLLMNYSLALGFNFEFKLPYNFGLSLGFNSYEDFRYMVLGAPSFSATLSYTLNESWAFYFSACAHYVDFFTLSSAYEDAEFKLSARFMF